MIRTIRPKIKISIDRTQMYCYGCNLFTVIYGTNECRLFGTLKYNIVEGFYKRHKKCLESER
jgi:hypothetical protein